MIAADAHAAVAPIRFDSKPKPAEYIYIVGAGGSGSTLLELMLAGHPRIEPMGELALFSIQIARGGEYRCSCNRLLGDCPIWKQVINAVAAEHGVDMNTHPFRFRLSDVGWEEAIGVGAPVHWLLHHYYRAWRYAKYRPLPILKHAAGLSIAHRRWVRNRLFVADTFRRIAACDGVIDSSKDYIGLRDLLAYGDRPIKAVYLTRDPRGVCATYLRKNPQADIDQACRQWVRVNRRVLHMLDGVDRDDWLHVRYEDLCADPAGSLSRLCDFLGYAYTADMVAFDSRVYHTVAGSKIRYRGIDKIEERMTWREKLNDDQLARIRRIAGPLAGRLGYAASDA